MVSPAYEAFSETLSTLKFANRAKSIMNAPKMNMVPDSSEQAQKSLIRKYENEISQLKQEYKEGEMTLDDALDLAVKVLSKTLDLTKLSPEKIEIATLRRVDEKTKIEILKGETRGRL